MDILVKLTKRNLLLNKKRAIGTIIGILLSVALICAVSGMFTSFRTSLLKNSISGSGYYHIALNGMSRDKIKNLNLNKDIKDIYYTYELGDSKVLAKDNDYSYLTVYSLSRQNFDSLSYKMIDGEYPKDEFEAVVTENLVRETGIEIGDYIELDIVNNKGDRESKKYKITGIVYRRKNSNGNIVITTNDISDNIWTYISLKNPKDYKNSFMELLEVDNYEDIEQGNIEGIDYNFVINYELLRWEVFAFSDSTNSMLLAVVGVVITIIIIVSVFCIRNSFAISTTEKMKMYGMLASVGATKKQIRKSVLIEGLLLSLIGIPLGILCGMFAVFVLVNIVNLLLGDYLFNNIDGVIFSISSLSILISIILGLVTVYFSSISSARTASRVSPIDNLRNSKDIKISSKKLRVPKIINKIFKTGGVLAYKNLKRSKKKYRTTVISLTVSIFVFISMYSFINIAYKESGMYYQDYKYNIIVNLPSEYDLENEEYKSYSIDNINKIRNLNNINNSYLLYRSIHSGKISDKGMINYYSDDYNTEIDEDVYVAIYALDDNSFNEYINRLGINYEYTKDKGILLNRLYYYSNIKEKEIIADRYKYKKGDLISMRLGDNLERELSVPLADVTYEAPIGLEEYYYSGGFLIVNKEYFNEVEFYPDYLYIDAKEPYDVYENIEKIDDMVSIDNIYEQVKLERAMLLVISIFLYGFITVITLIGVTNIFNTITSNMELRQKEFAMLKSIGMTKREFNRMVNLETIFYSSKSLIYGIFFGLIGSYLINMAFNEKVERSFELPINAIIISIVFVFIIVYIIMRYSIKKFNKKNIIDTIRNENV